MEQKDIQVLIDQRYDWRPWRTDDTTVYVKGHLWFEGALFKGDGAARRIAQFFDGFDQLEPHHVKKFASKAEGHFSFIYETSRYVIALVDKIRSQPLYYSETDARIVVSNSAPQLQEALSLNEKDDLAALEFEMAGYTLGSKTLFAELQQLRAGEALLVDKATHACETVRYYLLTSHDEPETRSEQDWMAELDDVVSTTFSKLIESLDGAPVFIPLSGGLDSRFILAVLKELGYDNLHTYTYGIEGLWEIERAQFIADSLGVPWHYLKFEPRETKELFHTADRRHYYDYASGLNSIPHLAEYYALLHLRDRDLIPSEAVIINGQTGDFLTGGHIPQDIATKACTVEQLISAIIDKHFSLWTDLKSEENLAYLAEEIQSLLGYPDDVNLSTAAFAQGFELFEWQERQAKYVVNGQRAYEWLNFDWRLPLWSDEMMKFWGNVHWELKTGQALYKKYLKLKNYGGVFDVTLPRQYSYMPLPIKLFRMAMGGLNLVFPKDISAITNKYSRYYMSYAPYYLHSNYFDYLKEARWHRNPVSYWVRYYLQELFG